MSETPRERLTRLVLAETTAGGDEYVQPHQMGAHIESWPGSDAWRSPDDEATLMRVFSNLVERYIKKHGNCTRWPAKVSQAVDEFEEYPDFENLLVVFMLVGA